MFVYARSLATVVRVDGGIDASNAGQIATEIRRFTKARSPLIIDLSRLDFLGIEGFQQLLALNHQHQAAGLYCRVVSGVALDPLVRVVRDHGLPLVTSVAEALQLIDDGLATRRHVPRLVR
ncbi:STAS domain-containing protein [Mycobacterium camsae]|uniref:STAS domain-containing protein n=1 Tax=Mycobacterium gordonae TaxID=1778 RepID=UPI00197F5BF9|nr:STAS domain-containing protein [Mycobacterium gordonae]